MVTTMYNNAHNLQIKRHWCVFYHDHGMKTIYQYQYLSLPETSCTRQFNFNCCLATRSVIEQLTKKTWRRADSLNCNNGLNLLVM